MQRRNISFDDWACTFTFCECAENGVGMEQLGALGGRGLTEADLRAAAAACERAGIACELIDLVAAAGVGAAGAGQYEPAFVLVMRRALPVLLANAAAAAAATAAAEPAAAEPATEAATAAATSALVEEHRAIAAVVDKKALFRGEVKNKNARWNLCFADYRQEPEYAAGRGRVIDFADVPLLSTVRAGIGRFFGAPYARLLAEGNYYYDVARTGIGFHGDAERRVVIALRLGAPIPLHYQWYSRHQPVGARVVLQLAAGDMYAMSEKAVGTDWKRSAIPTLRHAAGGPAYTK